MMPAIAIVFQLIISGALPGADLYLTGHDHHRAGRHGDAVQAFTDAAALEGPLQEYAHVRAATSRAIGGDREGAQAALRRYIASAPEGPWKLMAQAELAMLLHGDRNHPEAVPHFDSVLSIELQPSWMSRYRWAAATSEVVQLPTMAQGYERFAEFAQRGRFRSERRDAAIQLSRSPDFEHGLIAIEALLDNGAARDAANPLARIQPLVPPTGEAQAQLLYLRGRFLIDTDSRDEGRELLREAARRVPESVWARRARLHLVQSLIVGGNPAAREELDSLVRDFPTSEETGEILWWYGNRLAGQDNPTEAAAQYLRLAERNPAHARADRALFLAGEGFREAGMSRDAARFYTLLQDRHPRSRWTPEAAYRRGQIHQSTGDQEQAIAAFRVAAHGPIGDFYVHRALDRLAEKGQDEGRAGANLGAAGSASLVRPVNLSVAINEPANPGETWQQRLHFFGMNGLEEAEWEALYQSQHLSNPADVRNILLSLGLAGVGGTAMEFARAMQFGEDEYGHRPERLLIEFPRAYWPEFIAMGRDTGLDPYFLVGLAKQESLFRARAVSSAGATGVMQLMPATANWMVDVESAITRDHLANLMHPSNSIRLGAHYMKRQVNTNNGNLVFAACAYNAGPGNLRRWRRENPTNDLDAFIDWIPFSETRGFVKRVLGNYAAYRSLYAPED